MNRFAKLVLLAIGLMVACVSSAAVDPEAPVSPVQFHSSVSSEIRHEASGFWLFLDGVRTPAWPGMVYQRTAGTRHILSYSNSLHSLFKPLDDAPDGGLADGTRLESMGIQMIRVYELPVDNEDDVKEVKDIFRRLFIHHRIRVLIGDWAGLHSGVDFSRPETRIRLQMHLRKLGETYAGEPWVLGWQIGNENNYYLRGGKLGSQISLEPQEYYALMDQLAGVLKEELARMGVRQFVALGQGDLDLSDARMISTMTNIDALGINCYRNDPAEIEQVIATATNNLPQKAIFFAEIGLPASSPSEQDQQANYIKQSCAVIFSHAGGRLRSGAVLGAFLHEATDQSWKRLEHGNDADAHYGILDKSSEVALRQFFHQQNDFFEMIVPSNEAPRNLIDSAWRCLGMEGSYAKTYGRDYGNAMAYATRIITLYQAEAAQQQASLRAHADESTWALDAVGTGYFILGYSWMLRAYDLIGAQDFKNEDGSKALLQYLAQRTEIGVVQAANKSATGDPSTNASLCMRSATDIFQELLNRFPDARLRREDGSPQFFDHAIQARFPELSPPFFRPSWVNGIKFVFGALILILWLSRLAGRHIGLSKIRTEPMMDRWGRAAFLAALILELVSIFFLGTWWFHPVRMHYYTVRPWLYWSLSAIGTAGIIFYQAVWVLMWSARRPIYEEPRRDYRVAIVTTRVASEPAEEVEATLDKMDVVKYPHDSYLLDEENSAAAKHWCIHRNVIHFSRKGIARYNQERGIFQKRTKGGNLNAWLYEHGRKYDFVVFLDPDHGPNPDFLNRVLGYFSDPNVAFVQAPHVFYNRRVNWIARGAAEQSFFFCGPIQMGLFGIGACVINGSHTTIRISDLLATREKGYAVHDADDILTTIRLQALGKVGVYTPEVLAEGLVPENWGEFIKQQRRWAASMFNLFWFYYPVELMRIPWPAKIGHLLLCAFYMLRLGFVALLILPFVSVGLGNPPVNAHLAAFGLRYSLYLTAHMMILAWLGQKYLIKGGSHRGFWYRAGILWISSWWDFVRAFFEGSKSGRVKARKVAGKWAAADNPPLPAEQVSKKKEAGQRRTTGLGGLCLQVLPHLILAGAALLTFFYAAVHRLRLETVWGQLIFIALIFFSQTYVALRVLLRPLTTREEPEKSPDHL